MKSLFRKIKTLVKANAPLLFAIIIGIVLIAIVDDEPLFSIIGSVYFSLLAFWVIRWLFKQTKLVLKAKSEKSTTELRHLQSQVNPHFFFNTLNNLYGLVEKDAKKAQEMILKLSDMMRYSIYEGEKNRVNLEEEVEYLKNYIELHKMRYHKKTDVQFNIHIQEEGVTVMPLLFIILVENAFKHGVEKLRKGSYVHITMMANSESINFAVENNFDPNETTEEPGIGLKNLKSRLKLVYRKKHSFSCVGKDDVYKAQLSLQLND